MRSRTVILSDNRWFDDGINIIKILFTPIELWNKRFTREINNLCFRLMMNVQMHLCILSSWLFITWSSKTPNWNGWVQSSTLYHLRKICPKKMFGKVVGNSHAMFIAFNSQWCLSSNPVCYIISKELRLGNGMGYSIKFCIKASRTRTLLILEL